MSSVYFPFRVVALFRHLVHVVAGYSVAPRSGDVSAHNTVSSSSWTASHREWWRRDERWAWLDRGALNNAFSWPWISFNLSSFTTLSSYPGPEHSNMLPPPENMIPNPPGKDSHQADTIHRLIQHPALFDPLRTPRYPIVLCHGLYGFDERGPSSFPIMRMQYWSNVLRILQRTVKAEVIVTSVPSTGSVTSRAESLHRTLNEKALGRGVNLIAHSMGGLDCRQLITHIKPTEYAPLSLTTISTPHRGSPFMDWCEENIGIGRLIRREGERLAKTETDALITQSDKPMSETTFSSLSLSSLPSSFTTLLINVLDSPAYANLTSTYLNEVFNPNTPNDPSVKYFSVAGRMGNASVWHPFWLPKMVLDGVEKQERERLKEAWDRDGGGSSIWANEEEWGNDGLVTIQSAKWGEFLGVMEGVDHWEIRGARGLELSVDFGAQRDWSWLAGAWRKEQASKPKPPAPLKERDDDVIKASTEKLSAVFDWVIEQVPTAPTLMRNRGKLEMKESNASEGKKVILPEKEKVKPRNDLETKADLERFYVALSRKLYDEGL